MIRTFDLSIGYRRGKKEIPVQNHLNLHAEVGEMLSLIGPNGCGKSTLLRTLCGLQEPLDGKIQVQGIDLDQIPFSDRAKLFGLVLTDQIRLGYITVKQMVAMGRHPYTSFSGRLGKEDEQRVEESMTAVHLENFADRLLTELSDGEHQRVMIAKALAQDTPFILLDEPTSFLDLPNRVEMMLLLKKLASARQKIILISTHEIDLALKLSDQIWLMSPGKHMETGTPAELMKNQCIQSVFHSESFGFESETGHIIIF
ncbi:MAG: ABC transporter ATP-binding protein [Bacteroidales bacterium]|nr:ABC transporter ATP-binding protein [Bacteroidales bacterium]